MAVFDSMRQITMMALFTSHLLLRATLVIGGLVHLDLLPSFPRQITTKKQSPQAAFVMTSANWTMHRPTQSRHGSLQLGRLHLAGPSGLSRSRTMMPDPSPKVPLSVE
jgi:hypothetical protein